MRSYHVPYMLQINCCVKSISEEIAHNLESIQQSPINSPSAPALIKKTQTYWKHTDNLKQSDLPL